MKKRNIFQKIKKKINDTCLCLRFPFLYPVSLVDGKHWHSYKIQKLLSKLKNKSFFDSFIDTKEFSNTSEIITEEMKNNQVYKVNDNVTYKIEQLVTDIYNIVEYKNGYRKKTYQLNINEHIKKCKGFEFLSQTGTFLCFNPKKDRQYSNYLIEIPRPSLNLYYIKNTYEPIFERDKWLINFIFNKWYYALYKIISWIYYYPLQYIFCIPTYSLLDCLEPGWRNTFGIKICKEIKNVLLRKGGIKALFNYKWMQVKEKFGTLRIYDHNSYKEIHDIIDKYEELTSTICINCGQPAKYITKGWITYTCENCINKDKRKSGSYYKIENNKNNEVDK